MFDCVSGSLSADGISGCILADDMGQYADQILPSVFHYYTFM